MVGGKAEMMSITGDIYELGRWTAFTCSGNKNQIQIDSKTVDGRWSFCGDGSVNRRADF